MDMASTDARRFPVETTTIQVDGVKTNVVQCSYDDHIMIRVTQIGKMGTLLASIVILDTVQGTLKEAVKVLISRVISTNANVHPTRS